MRDDLDIAHFKGKLEDELTLLEEELKTVARINPLNKDDWEPTQGGVDTDPSDTSEVSDRAEEFKAREAILNDLEIRYNNVKQALQRIADGTYGICEIGNGPIEHDRLLANPAARTCKKHLDAALP